MFAEKRVSKQLSAGMHVTGRETAGRRDERNSIQVQNNFINPTGGNLLLVGCTKLRNKHPNKCLFAK